jgi:hypothetical protein
LGSEAGEVAFSAVAEYQSTSPPSWRGMVSVVGPAENVAE